MIFFELREEYKKDLRYENSRQFFYYEGDIGRKTIVKDLSIENVLKGIENGKIAVFPIYEKQKMDVVKGHIDLGFTVYFMRYKDFTEFKKLYIDNCVNVLREEKEIKQKGLF